MPTSDQRWPISLFGAGSHAKVVASAIELAGRHRIVGVFDDNPATWGRELAGHKVLGGRDEFLQRLRGGWPKLAFVAIGDNQARKAALDWLQSQGCDLATVIHPTAVLAADATLGAGTFVSALAVVNAAATVAEGAIINSGAVVEHDGVVDNYCHVAPRATLCGGVQLSEGAFVGAGATVIPQRKLGAWSVVGAGAVVLDHLPPATTAVGVPARPLRSPSEPPATLPLSLPQRWSPWPHHDQDELAAVETVLRSGRVNYWTGNEGREFEREYAAALGRRHAVALANGTVALELALLALGVGPGDEVIVTPRTFIASASCAAIRGARPVFAEIDRDSQNITAETIARVIGPRTKAILAVHLGGWPCDMQPIMQLAEQQNLHVIEDCAQAHGATYHGRPVGSFGHLAAFSFCQDKIMTTGGEGGLLTMDDDALWAKAWSYKDHGKSHDAVYHRQHPPGFRWLHESFGTNWRMTEMQAAIGRVQLRKLPAWVAARRAHAKRLHGLLGHLPALRIPAPASDCEHAYYRFYAFVRPETLAEGWSRDRILEAAVAAGIPCFSGSCGEIYRERAFAAGLAPATRLPVARELGETSLCLLVHPTLSAAEVEEIGNTLRSIVEQATCGASVETSEKVRRCERVKTA